MTHTPGPWFIQKTKRYLVVRAKARINIAQVWKSTRSPEGQEADARLVMYAPELLAALHQIKDLAGRPEDVYRISRATIDKVEGAQHERST